MCAGLATAFTEAAATPLTAFVEKPRVIRSHQKDTRTGLNLNEQRRINTKVARGARFLDAAIPGWHRNRGIQSALKREDLEHLALVMEDFISTKGYQVLTRKALKAGFSVPATEDFAFLNGDGEVTEIYGAAYGFYNNPSLGRGLAWTKEITRRMTADTTAKLEAANGN
jgi:hypothetical protein